VIRECEPVRDRAGLRSCVVELQDFERALEPTLPKGEEMADRYLAHMLRRCAEATGRVFVAEEDGGIVGFVGVLARVVPEPDESQAYAYVSDLVVLPAYRRRGIGRALLEEAEAYARREGARSLRVAVLARNNGAGRLYHRMGFSDYTVQLVKPLP
jgi:ribosomal protein S18 acetylase RimI-like enzyme